MMRERSLQARIREQLERCPEARAFAFYGPEGQWQWKSREEMHARAARLARGMHDRGLCPGDVLVLVHKSDAFAAEALLASLIAGAVPLLVAPPMIQGIHSSLTEILGDTIRRSRASMAVCDPSLGRIRDRLCAQHPDTRFVFDGPSLASDADTLPPVSPALDDIVGMQLTSGTTGSPRICVWRQRNMLAALDGMVAAMGVSDDDVCVNWTPLYHDMGLVNNFLLCWATGTPLVMLSPQDFVTRPSLWLRAMSETGATVTWSPNFGFALTARRVLDAELGGVKLDHVRGFWNAAERIHETTMSEFRERFSSYGVNRDMLKTNFGCAENIGGATFTATGRGYPVETIDVDALQTERVARTVAPGSGAREMVVVGVGRPYPGMTINILDDQGNPLPEGHVGRVALDTPSRLEHYLDDPDATAEAIADGVVRTGDLGYLRGEELFWVGRSRERINVRGRKLDPSEFEPALLSVTGVRTGAFVAFGVDDVEHGTQRVVVLTEVKGRSGCDAAGIVATIRERIFQSLGVSVSEVVLVEPNTLAKTSSGKRRALHFRELFLSGGLDSYRIDPDEIAREEVS